MRIRLPSRAKQLRQDYYLVQFLHPHRKELLMSELKSPLPWKFRSQQPNHWKHHRPSSSSNIFDFIFAPQSSLRDFLSGLPHVAFLTLRIFVTSESVQCLCIEFEVIRFRSVYNITRLCPLSIHTEWKDLLPSVTSVFNPSLLKSHFSKLTWKYLFRIFLLARFEISLSMQIGKSFNQNSKLEFPKLTWKVFYDSMVLPCCIFYFM